MRRDVERGAVAVEMALLLPVLLILLLGIMEFGRAFNTQITLTNAARDAVRVMAIGNPQTAADTAEVKTKAKTAAVTSGALLAPELLPGDVNVGSCTDSPSGPRVTVTITYELTTLTGIAGPFTMTGKGVMRCGG
ncbi:TadE/TadG family type IV pilus assembly protein [Arthrobacter tecti]